MNRNILNWTGVLVLAALSAAPHAHAESATRKDVSQGETERVPSSVLQIPSSTHYYSPYAFIVDKKTRTLSVWQQTESGLKLITQVPADSGKKDGAKKNRGDFKTPEGVYFLQARLEGTTLDYKLYGKRAFVTDYPNFFDRLEGKTGDGIWLHAVPDEVPLTRGSRGCVVVRNNVILDLTQYIRLGRTPLIIKDKEELVSLDDSRKATSEVTQWIESWRSAWEKKDLDNYISKYDEEFTWMKMNRDKYREFKAGLNAKYQSISVKISRPLVFTHKGRAIVRFLQEYTSDQHVDFGEKVLYLRKGKEGYRIIGETWAAESSQLAKEEIESSSTAIGGDCESGKPGCALQSASID